MLTRLFFVLLLAIPCAAQDHPALARVHFYRTSNKIFAVLLSPSIYFDRDKVAKLPNGRYFEVSVAPGRYALRVDDEQFFAEHIVNFEAGHEYFVRMTFVGKTSHVLVGMGPHLQLDVVPQDEALSAIRHLKPVDPDKITSPETGPLPELNPPHPR